MKKAILFIALLAALCAMLLLIPARAADMNGDISPVLEPTAYSAAAQLKVQSSEAATAAVLQAHDIATSEMEHFRYLLYTPENPTEEMPLIVFLHRASGKGDDPELITSADDFPKYLQDGEFGNIEVYVLIPQLPSSQKAWGDIGDSLYCLIQKTVSEFSIDEDNISLTGFSMGGTGTWNLAAAYPALFARIAPLAGSARGVLDQASVLKEIPVRVFVGSDDTVIKPNSSKEMAFALKREKGAADIIIFDGADHLSVPPLTWLDESIGLVDWLIGKSE